MGGLRRGYGWRTVIHVAWGPTMAAMSSAPTRPFSRPLAEPRFRAVLWIVLGIAGWAGLLFLGSRLLAATPPKAGFDLELLLAAGRRVAAGQTPYDPDLVAGGVVQAPSLFYSYPPPVAQALSIVAGVPSTVMLVLWGLGATIGLVLVVRAVARRPWSGVARPAELVLPALAVAPFVFPFAVALLFGNLDAWFPTLYGAILLGALVGGRSGWAGAGLAFALAAVTKLHPASLAVWFLVRGWRNRRGGPAVDALPAADALGATDARANARPGPWFALAVALAVALVTITVSLALWGIGPWRDYLAVVRAGTGADLVDARNIGPAGQLAGLFGLSEAGARLLQAPVTLGVLALTACAALCRRDLVEGLAWATAASLVTLPVAWFHYPVALIPFAAAALARADGAARPAKVRWLVAAAVAASALTIAVPVLVWVAVALVLLGVRMSAPRSG